MEDSRLHALCTANPLCCIWIRLTYYASISMRCTSKLTGLCLGHNNNSSFIVYTCHGSHSIKDLKLTKEITLQQIQVNCKFFFANFTRNAKRILDLKPRDHHVVHAFLYCFVYYHKRLIKTLAIEIKMKNKRVWLT